MSDTTSPDNLIRIQSSNILFPGEGEEESILSCEKQPYNFEVKWAEMPFKNVGPIIVGFHGVDTQVGDFEFLNVGALVSQGRMVHPESLYEAQLRQRLGGLPEWAEDMKANHD